MPMGKKFHLLEKIVKFVIVAEVKSNAPMLHATYVQIVKQNKFPVNVARNMTIVQVNLKKKCKKYNYIIILAENIPERILPTQESSTEILQLWPVSNLVLNVSQMDQKITIREIMPEIKEIPMTVPSNIDYSNFNDLLVTDPEPEASEVLEIFQPPPVLRIGDKLLFLHEGNFVSENETTSPSSIITIIGAEGLEQGFEESAEESLNQPLFNNSNDLELKTSESTHILSLVKNKKKPEVTTTSVPEETTLVSTITNTNFPEDNETTTLEATTLTEIAQTETTTFFTENITTTMEENSTFTDIPSKESLEATSDSGETVQNTSNDFTENASIESSENPEVADMVQSTHSFDDAELLRDLTQKNSTLKNDVEMIDINKTYTKLPQKIIEKRANSAEAPGDDIFEQLRDEIYDDNTERILSAKEDKEESERIFRELLDETSTPKTVRKGDKNAEMIKKITDAIAKLTLRNKGGPLDFNLVGLVSGFFGPPRKKK